MSDAYEAAYAQILEGASSGKLTEFIEERGCEIVDALAARMLKPETLPNLMSEKEALIGRIFWDAIEKAMHDWAQDEADGKHTRDAK